MNFSPSIIKDLGVGVVNGQVIVYPQCPHRFMRMEELGITREIFKRSNDALPYFWYLIGDGYYSLANPYLLKDGNMATVTKRIHLAATYLLGILGYDLNGWFVPMTKRYGIYTLSLSPFRIEGTTAINVWPVESVWRTGGELTVSDAGLLKLSDKCFNHPAFVLKNEMLMQKYFYPELTHYRIHVIGLDKKVPHPSKEHRILEFKYDSFMDESFRDMMSRTMEIYELMSAKSWPKEEGRHRCRFCPITDCEHNIKANPLGYEAKYKAKHRTK